jgi:hypothetical protein
MMKETEAHRFRNNWSYAQELWKKKKIEHGLAGWTLKTMNASDKAGMCSYMEKTIYISTLYMRGHNCNYEKVKKVLMHEIAHALKPGHSHGAGWKEKCRELGGDSRLAVTMVLPGMEWAVTCSKCKWRQEYPSRPTVDGMLCGKCRTPIKIKHIK